MMLLAIIGEPPLVLKTACILLSVIIGDLEAVLIPLLLNWL
jgi:hypothetical protein